jgi:hypothetical protein
MKWRYVGNCVLVSRVKLTKRTRPHPSIPECHPHHRRQNMKTPWVHHTHRCQPATITSKKQRLMQETQPDTNEEDEEVEVDHRALE